MASVPKASSASFFGFAGILLEDLFGGSVEVGENAVAVEEEVVHLSV